MIKEERKKEKDPFNARYPLRDTNPYFKFMDSSCNHCDC